MNIAQLDIKDLKKIQIGGSKRQKKLTHIPSKRGINLARHENEQQKRKMVLIVAVAAVVLLGILVKFGVIDQYAKLREAESKYNETHATYLQTEEALVDYDKILLEYRTYSMDWLENDDSGRYVSVARRKVLDMIEAKIMPKGTVVSVSISGDTLTVNMQGMNLKQIAAMCAEIEEEPFVEAAILHTASTNGSSTKEVDSSGSGALSFNIEIRLQSEKEEG